MTSLVHMPTACTVTVPAGIVPRGASGPGRGGGWRGSGFFLVRCLEFEHDPEGFAVSEVGCEDPDAGFLGDQVR